MNTIGQRRPLEGLRALELAEVWAGPFCGSLLGDLGAEVLKIESIQRIYRGNIKPAADSTDHADREPGERPWNREANFNALNRNKKGVTLDLASEAGVLAFKDLVAVSDIVFCNFAAGVMEKFGLDFPTLQAIRPDIIVLQMPGYGNTGPYKNYRTMGMAIDAITGHTSLRGYPDLPLSTNSMVHHPDAVAGINAVFAICSALFQRAITGIGQFIDMSQAESFMTHLGEVFIESQITGIPRERLGNRHRDMAPHGCYPCLGNDKWVTISVRSEQEWAMFCQATGLSHLRDDPRFSSLSERLKHHSDLDVHIANWTSMQDRYQATEILQTHGVPAGPVLDCGPDTYDDPHLQSRDYFQIVDHRDAGIFMLSGPIWNLSSNLEKRHDPAPCLGEHNKYILGDLLGFSIPYLKVLNQRGIIGSIPLEGSDTGGSRRVY